MTTDAAASTLIFAPIPSGDLVKIRAAGVDEAGNRLIPQVDAEGGSPLRCCLRETRAGEQVLLIAYTPPGTSGPYAERGPVFIHPGHCGGYPTPHCYPPELSHRRQVVRGYDQDGRIAEGILADDGEHALSVIQRMLARQDISLVQLRNVGHGCYNCTVRRGGAHCALADRRRRECDGSMT